MLIRFRVKNHRSIREAVELSMVSTALRTNRPKDNDWLSATVRVAGIYGPNASGKSNVLGAIAFALTAVKFSATHAATRSGFPYEPFKLDRGAWKNRPSEYELDFVYAGARLRYGFSSTGDGVVRETLTSYETARPRLLFDRTGSEFKFGRLLGGPNQLLARSTKRNVLFLSSAANNDHPYLSAVWKHLVGTMNYARFSEIDQSRRLTWARSLLENPSMLAQAQSLLRFADVGISEIVLHEEENDPHQNEVFRRLLKTIESTLDSATRKERKRGSSIRTRVEVTDGELDAFRKSIRFVHGQGDSESFGQADESSGTVAWLSLAVPSIHALSKGSTLLIDELDASLHPRLSSAIVSMFKTPDLNPLGAQLIFTSHDATLLGQFSHSPLERDEIWFCEKDDSGATDLYSLAEFPTRAGDNFERRYLQGRYGAVPMISSADLREALDIAQIASEDGLEVIVDEGW